MLTFQEALTNDWIIVLVGVTTFIIGLVTDIKKLLRRKR